MTDEERNFVKFKILDLAKRLRLGDWVIEVSQEPCDDGTSGQCSVFSRRRIGIVHLPENFLEQDPLEQVDTAVHELLHLYTQQVVYAAGAILEDHASLSRNDLTMIRSILDRELDLVVDSLASVLARHELPNWQGDLNAEREVT